MEARSDKSKQTHILHFFIHAWARLYWTLGDNIFATILAGLLQKEMVQYNIFFARGPNYPC